MNLAAVRALYDQEQRIDNIDSGVRIIQTPLTVRLIEDNVRMGAVIYSKLDAANADEAIAQEIEYFDTETNVMTFEWKVFDYDSPADLLDRVKAHGFEVHDPDAICVLDLADLPERLRQPPTHDIRRIIDAAGVEDVLAVNRAVWGDEDKDWMRTKLITQLTDTPEILSVYVAYVDGVPASSCWMDVHEGRSFSGLWGGSTVEQYRGRGLYTELIAIRAQEAIRRGIHYLTIDASPMSRPIVEKHGFQFMAWAYECNYAFDRATE